LKKIVKRRANMKKLGLALGGGGLKGLAHIGVLEILHDYRIPVSMISGTSIGSVIAAMYASGMSPYEIEKIALEVKSSDYIDYNFGGFLKCLFGFFWPGNNMNLDGIIKGRKLERLIYRLTGGKTLQDVKIPLAIVACDIDSGQEVVFTNQNLEPADKNIIIIKNALLSEAVRASTSIPATFVPRRFREMQLIDGGVRSIVPVTAQKMMGAEYILAVNLGRETYNTKVSGIFQIISRTLNILTYETSDTAEEFYADMIIFPGVIEVKLDEVEKAPEIIRAGRRAMKSKISEIKREIWGPTS